MPRGTMRGTTRSGWRRARSRRRSWGGGGNPALPPARAGGMRSQEVLPAGDALRARRGTFLGLTRPELAVLMAWTKIQLQHDLLASALPDDPFLEAYLLAYFPAPVVARFPDAVRDHPLRRQIVAN